MRILPGDIVATIAEGERWEWWRRLVLLATGSQYTHVALYIGNGQVIEADWGGTVRISPLPANHKVLHRPLTRWRRHRLIRWAHRQIGKPYSWLQLAIAPLRFLGPLRNVALLSRGWACTALVTRRVLTPGEAVKEFGGV